MTPRPSSTADASRISEPTDWTDRVLPTLVAIVVVLAPTLSVAYTETAFGRALTGSAVGTALLLTPLAIGRVRRATAIAHPVPLLVIGVMTVAMTVSVAVHPSQQGTTLTVAAWIGSALALAIASFDRRTIASHVVTPLLATAALQGVLMTVQWFTKEPWGLRWLAPSRSLQRIDGFLRPQGTSTHVYEPALLALLAIGAAVALADDDRHHRLWLATTAAAAAGIAVSHSRAALVGLAAMAVIGLVSPPRRPHRRRILLVAVGAFGLVAVLASSGWVSRLGQSTAGDLDDATSGRIELAREAAEVVATSPLVGVGPGRYLEVAAELGIADPDFPIATHGFILLLGAELGLPAAAAIAGLLGWTYVAAWRRNRVVFAAAVGVLPFLVVDKLLYDRIFGILLLSIWLGTTAALLGRTDADVAS